MSVEQEDSKTLASLAMGLVEHPRASLQELAKAIGISKASLYRFSHTREALISRLTTHSIGVLNNAIKGAGLETVEPLEGLKKLTSISLEHRELSAFLTYYWREGVETDPFESEATLDAFFLRGQQLGAFRIDVPAAALTEIWFSVLIGLMDGERRGRVARAGLANLVESVFLIGAGSRTA